jgi:serine/threonine protein kinase/Tol biopolymer transport system component
VLSLLGSGGMGEVYRARDHKLNRDVALKILPGVLADDPERLARFKREAQVLASLNHPNIAHIHGLEESDGAFALVLELVEGPTLAERIANTEASRLSIDRALSIARQIAEALEAAHEQGIVHRDLKPANIKVRSDGTVKLLDFGVAKAMALEPAGPPAGDLSDALTVTSPATTRMGIILGTATYMSPEQARGKEVDKRADIWAFGCVLYEMLTGQPAFPGTDVSEVLAGVIKSDVAWSALPAETPPKLRTLLQRCLHKDPRQRLRDIGDARIEIDEMRAAPTLELEVSTTVHRVTRERLAWAVAGAAVVMALVAGVMSYRRPTAEPDTRVYRTSILSPPGGSIPAVLVPSARFALSPDGRRLAFVGAEDPQGTLGEILAGGVTRLWVQSLDGLTAEPLPGTEGAIGPFWSPDSRFIGFRSGQKVKIIDTAGGPPLTLADTSGTHTGTWNQDGVILFSSTAVSSPIRKVSASGGPSSPVTTLNADNGETQHWDPFFLPDGRHFLYLAIGSKASPASPNGIYVTALDSNERKLLVPGGSNAMYAQGRLFFLRGQTLMTQPFDVERLELTGDAVAIAEQVITGGGSGIRGAYTVSQTGILAYQAGSAEIGGNADPVSQLVWFDRSGKQIGTLGDRARFRNVELAPDGQRASVAIFDTARRTRDLWLADVARGLRTRFTFDPANEADSIWSPDGSSIVFSANRKGPDDLYQRASSGAGTEEELLADDQNKYPLDWSPDGRFILFSVVRNSAAADEDLWILPMFGDRKPFPFDQTPFSEPVGLFSPDGRWIAYVSNESGRSEVFVAPFQQSGVAPAAAAQSATGGKWQVSTAGGDWPRWRRDGNEIFYLAPDNKLMVASVNGQGSTFQVGAVRPLFDLRAVTNQGSMYDVAADGQRFLVATLAEEDLPAPVPITLVVNWQAALRP